VKKINWKGRVVLGVALAALTAPVLATHSWSTYHWKRTSAEIAPPVGDNVDSRWDSYLDTAIVDWNVAKFIQSAEQPGSTNPRNCRGVSGTIQVCNYTYGNNGWLGLATISTSGGHIVQGTTKLNDTYFNTAKYNTPAWRALVMCQEIGHDYGLGHQDEDFNTDNTKSCMDYTSVPEGNEHPDAHDYEQLELIYGGHSETAATAMFGGSNSAGVPEVGDTMATWGKPIKFDRHGRPHVFQRIDGPGRVTLTHVFWAIGEGPRRGGHAH
jgi:hypothetical protein